MRLSKRKTKWTARTILITLGVGLVVGLALIPVPVRKDEGAVWPLGHWGHYHIFGDILLGFVYGAIGLVLSCCVIMAIHSLFKLAEWVR